MCGCEPVPKDYSGDKAALDAFSIFNGNVAPIYNGLFVHISPRLHSRSAAEERDQALERQGDNEVSRHRLGKIHHQRVGSLVCTWNSRIYLETVP